MKLETKTKTNYSNTLCKTFLFINIKTIKTKIKRVDNNKSNTSESIENLISSMIVVLQGLKFFAMPVFYSNAEMTDKALVYGSRKRNCREYTKKDFQIDEFQIIKHLPLLKGVFDQTAKKK